MLDKVRSNLFSIFMRKIGFSVGLEHTLDRLIDFSRMYSSRDTLSYADISRLLHDDKPQGWDLEPSNEHILDVLRSLGVVDARRGEVSVLEVGDILGITSKIVTDDEEFKKCAALTFAHSLLLADGDIFLNALASDFDPVEFSRRITSAIEHKRTILERHFSSDQQRHLMYSAINIEAQISNRGNRGPKPLIRSPDPNRLTAVRPPLSPAVARPETIITTAYLAKALPRRKAWAVSLGLADSSGRATDGGANLLASMASAGYAGPGCLSLWPLEHELHNRAFSEIKQDAFPVLDSWEFLMLVGQGLNALPSISAIDEHDRAIELVRQIVTTYKDLNQSKSIVRTELPIRVAYGCIANLSIQSGFLPDLPSVLEKEQLAPSPRIDARPSRLAEFALSAHK